MSNLLPLLVEQFHKKTTKTDKHMVVVSFSDKAHLFIIYFYGGFSRLRINLPTKLCRCFRQALFVSHKALSFPTNVFCFRQALVVSDNRFVGKSRVPKLDKHVTACRTCVPATCCNTTRKLVYKHTTGPIYLVPSADGHTKNIRFVLTCQFRTGFGINDVVWITASFNSCTFDEEHPITTFHVKRCTFSGKCS
jgi:hypothetical protein